MLVRVDETTDTLPAHTHTSIQEYELIMAMMTVWLTATLPDKHHHNTFIRYHAVRVFRPRSKISPPSSQLWQETGSHASPQAQGGHEKSRRVLLRHAPKENERRRARARRRRVPSTRRRSGMCVNTKGGVGKWEGGGGKGSTAM